MRFGADYDLMLKAQRTIENQLNGELDATSTSKLTQALVMVVAYKRELRGLPRLKAADLIANMKRLPRASAPAEAAPVEISATIEPDKESLKNSFSQTVTAPPTGDAPISGRGER